MISEIDRSLTKKYPAYRLDPWGWPIEYIIGHPIKSRCRVVVINLYKLLLAMTTGKK